MSSSPKKLLRRREFVDRPPGHGGSVTRPSHGRRSTTRTSSPRTASCSPSRDERNGPTFIARRARLPSAPLLNLLAFLAYRSSHHTLPSPAVPSLDAGIAPSSWHTHRIAPSHVRHRARTARHSKPSLSTSLQQTSTFPSLHEPSLSPQPFPTARMTSAEVCSCVESRRFELFAPSPAREAHLSWQTHRPVSSFQQHHQRLSDSPCGDDAHAS
jgi:hypothetical protein